jgi:hypothetical protein
MGSSSQLFRQIDVTANVASEHHAGADFDAKTEHPRSVSSPKSYGRTENLLNVDAVSGGHTTCRHDSRKIMRRKG